MRKLKFKDILISLLVIIFDQVTKMIVINNMSLYQQKIFINGFINWHYTRNEGAAWSMFSGKQAILVIVACVVCVGILIYLFKTKTCLIERVGWLFVIGGAIGNLIDRVRFNYVIDFIETAFMDFPIFNVADSFVCIGVGLVILSVFVIKGK